MSLSQSPSTHTLCFCVVASQTRGCLAPQGSGLFQGVFFFCGSAGERAQDSWLGWLDLWIFWSELVLDQEGSELKSRGLVARLGVDMNLRLSCNLGCFYGMLGWGRGGPRWWAMRATHECGFMIWQSWWGQLMNNVAFSGVHKDLQ